MVSFHCRSGDYRKPPEVSRRINHYSGTKKKKKFVPEIDEPSLKYLLNLYSLKYHFGLKFVVRISTGLKMWKAKKIMEKAKFFLNS